MTKSVVRKPLTSAIAAFIGFGATLSGAAYAEPAQDPVAKLKELTHQAEQLTETMNAVQLDLDTKLRLLGEAERKHAEDLAALDAAKAQLEAFQVPVSRLAAAVYMGGRTDGPNAILTAASPTALIDDLAIQRVIATQTTSQMQDLRRVTDQVQAMEAASAISAADARAATNEAAALRADLQTKKAELQTQIAAVKVSYAMLAPAQQAALGPGGGVPMVGISGLTPNARNVLQYIVATYPGVQSIGGVRADPLPDHPSGRAIDVMIGSDMALGDAINADIQSQAGRFGVAYTMWRVASHFDHVHITVS